MSGRKIEEQKYAEPKKRRTQSSAGNPADWANADAVLVLRAIELISKNGGALRFGYTRDGGAYAIGIYENGQSDTEYLKPGDDLDAYFKGIIRDFT